MASPFDSLFGATGRRALLDIHGESLVYTAPGGSSESVTGMWAWGMEDSQEDIQGKADVRRARVQVLVADVPGFVKGAAFEKDGVTFGVVRELSRLGGLVELELEQVERTRNTARRIVGD